MTSPLRLLGSLAFALALLVPAATAQAAPTGVNVSHVNNNGDPYVTQPGNLPGEPSDTQETWTDLDESGATLVRTFANWHTLTGPTRVVEMNKYFQFVVKARARGMTVLIALGGGRDNLPTPDEYSAVAGDLANTLKGMGVSYEIWNEEDGPDFWPNGPQPAAYTAMLKKAYSAIKAPDPAATVLVGGLVGNNFDFVEQLYENGAQGSFDGIGVHTDTACLTTDPREYYREPSGRIGRYSFTGYREVRATMLAHGDDKPVWMTELGWSTTNGTCARGGRAGTKEAGVSEAVQADYLSKAYGCLAGDPYVKQAAWFNSHDLQTGSGDDSLNLGLSTTGFVRKPAFNALQRAVAATPIECGGTIDAGAPVVTIVAPTDGAKYLTSLPIHVTATDSEGVNDIDLLIDGKEVPLRTVKDGTSASVKFEYGGAKNLSYGPHVVTAIARDEAKNAGKAVANVTHVGGGNYPYTVKTGYALKVGKVKSGKIKVRGKISPKGTLSRLAHGRAYVYFSRFDTKSRRWKKVSRFSRDAKHAFTLRYKFKKRGVWRVTGNFKPKKGFKASRAKTARVKVR